MQTPRFDLVVIKSSKCVEVRAPQGGYVSRELLRRKVFARVVM